MNIEEAVDQLSPANFKKVYAVASALNQHYQKDFITKFFLISDVRKKGKAFVFLKGIKAIRWYEFHGEDPDKKTHMMIDVELDIANFSKCWGCLKAKRGGMPLKRKQEIKSEDTDVMYEVAYTPALEILINKFRLTQLDNYGENQLVFDYVFAHPNKEITAEEIKSYLSQRVMKKSLSKIVDNWGFAGETRKVFFRVSKRMIVFRNPIRKKDLEAFKISHLAFPKK